MQDSSGDRHAVVDMTARRSRLLGPLQAVRRHSTATGSARGVLNVLASYADADTFLVHVGRHTLARTTGLSRSTLRRAIRALEDGGELVTIEAGTGDRPSRYRLALPVHEPVDNPTIPGREGVHSEPGGGSPRPRGGVHPEPQPGIRPVLTGEGAPPRTCPAHASVDNPPPCHACRRARQAAEAADEQRAATARSSRLCPHGRIDGARILGAGAQAARVCPECDTDTPP